MYSRFTEDHLILYMYNELNETERLALQQAIDSGEELRNRLSGLLEVKNQLDGLSLSPNPTTIDMIMEHAHFEEHSH